MILWLVLIPLLMAVVLWPVSRWRFVASPLSAATCLLMAILVSGSTDAHGMLILGRSISMSPEAGTLFAHIFVLLAIVMLYAQRTIEQRLLYPLTLGAMGCFVAATAMENLTIAVLLLQIGSVLSVMLIPSDGARAPMVALRGLVLIVLSGLILLAAAWMSDRQIDGELDLQLLVASSIALLIGCSIALGAAPFHIWLPPIFRHGSLSSGIVLSTCMAAPLLLRLQGLIDAAVPQAQVLGSALLAVGIATSLASSIGAMSQRTISGALAYAAVGDLGLILVGLGIGSEQSATAAISHTAYRAVGIVLVTMARGLLRQCTDNDDVSSLRGSVRRAPLGVLALTIGGLSLVGLPPTAGFSSRLVLYRLLAAQRVGLALVVAASAIGPGWAFMRCTIAALRPATTPDSRRESLRAGLATLPLVAMSLAPGLLARFVGWLPSEVLYRLLGA